MRGKKLGAMLLAVLLCITQAVAAIPTQVMAKETALSVAGLSANPNYTFQTIEGGTISSTVDASKDATIIIFGRTTCGNTASEIKSISGSGWIHNKNVSVICVEINQASQEETSAFASQYGCDEITFCYDTGAGSNQALWKYLSLAGSSGSVTLPVTVLIDADNNIRNTLTGYQAANTIFNEMNKFAEISGTSEDGTADVERSLTISGKEDYDAASQVLKIVNQTRAAAGASALKMDKELTETAMVRAAEIALFYSHTRPNGQSCFSIFRSSSAMGENIALGQISPENVMDSWNNSPGHYANIIDTKFTSIGIGCFIDSNGTCYWVQCFDNGAAVNPAKSGKIAVTRTVSVLQSLIELNTAGSYEIGCDRSETEIRMSVENINSEWSYSRPELSTSNFDYKSSNPAVAEVDGNGVIKIKAAGTVVITASLKVNSAIQVSRTITKKDHSYSSTIAAPTYTSQGYTKHTCINCGDFYQDTYTPMLTLPADDADSTVGGGSTGTDGDSINTGNGSTTNTPKVTAPAAPKISSLTAKNNGVTVKWGQVKDATGYYIYRTDGGDWEKVATIKKSATTSYTDKKATGNMYMYGVVAYKTSGEVTATSKASASKVYLKAPKLSSVKNKKTKSATVKYSENFWASGYQICYSTSSKFAKGNKIKKANYAGTTSKVLKSLKKGKKYYVRVRVYSKINGKTYYSAWSNSKSVKIAK